MKWGAHGGGVSSADMRWRKWRFVSVWQTGYCFSYLITKCAHRKITKRWKQFGEVISHLARIHWFWIFSKCRLFRSNIRAFLQWDIICCAAYSCFFISAMREELSKRIFFVIYSLLSCVLVTGIVLFLLFYSKHGICFYFLLY